MIEKYIEDYLPELEGYFPEIDKKDLARMTRSLTRNLSLYSKVWYRGFTVRSKKSLLEDGKFNRFTVARVFGRKHWNDLKKAGKKAKATRYGKGK